MKIINICLLILWMIIIFIFSSDNGTVSSNKSDVVVDGIISFISNITNHDFTDSELNTIINNCVFIVRKSAHLLEYFILGILIINVLKDYKVLSINICMIGLFIGVIYACGDEIHQLFVPLRSGKITDVLIDALGNSLGIFSYFVIYNKLTKKRGDFNK